MLWEMPPATSASVARSREDNSRGQRFLPPRPEPDSLPGGDGPGDDGLTVEIAAQIVGQGRRAGIAATGLLLQALQADRLEIAG